jgi:hypothetical protein
MLIISRMASWLDNLPLMTVQRTLHLIHPSSRHWHWSLTLDITTMDRDIFQYFTWTLQADPQVLAQADDAVKRNIGRFSVVLAFQPPWILSYQDLKEFSDCRSVCYFLSRHLNRMTSLPFASFLRTCYPEMHSLRHLKARIGFGPR